jgi:hypothetical protein
MIELNLKEYTISMVKSTTVNNWFSFTVCVI